MSGRVLQRYAFSSNVLKSHTQLRVKSISFKKNEVIFGGFCRDGITQAIDLMGKFAVPYFTLSFHMTCYPALS